MAAFDPETLNVLRVALDEAWNNLPAEIQAKASKGEMASRILARAAAGERDAARLRIAALFKLAK